MFFTNELTSLEACCSPWKTEGVFFPVTILFSQIWFSHDAIGHIAVFDWITKPQKLSSVMSLACSAPPGRTAPMRAALVFRHPRPPIWSTPWRRGPAHCSIRIWSALSRAFRIMRMAIVACPFRRYRVSSVLIRLGISFIFRRLFDASS